MRQPDRQRLLEQLQSFEDRVRQIIRFFPQVRVHYLEAADWMQFDPAGLAFRNINTPSDRQSLGGAA